MAFYKMVIVVRKDLGMRAGKMCSQAAHAVESIIEDYRGHPNIVIWREKHNRTKITVRVESEEQLLSVVEQARAADLPVSLVQDSGKTEFRGVATYTVAAVGPAPSGEIDKITGDLSLL